MTWNVHDESEETATALIAFARSYTESNLINVPGVLFVISSLTGVTTNPKRKGDDGDDDTPPEVRPGIGFIVCFVPGIDGGDNRIRDVLHRTGLTIHPSNEVSKHTNVKSVTSRSPTNSVSDLVNRCSTVLKDHKQAFVVQMLEESLEYCRVNVPNVPPLPRTPVHVVVANQDFTAVAVRLTQQLHGVGVAASINIEEPVNPKGIDRYASAMPTGLDLAVEYVCEFLQRKKLGLLNGSIYKKPARARVTYEKHASVEEFMNVLVANPEMKGKIKKAHLASLINLFKHPNCSLIQQLTVDYDLVEVLHGKCWHLAQMAFIDTPIATEDVGVITPRAFFPWNPSDQVNPLYFMETIENSFPDADERAHYLLKWYQLSMHHRNFMKQKRLMVWGPKNCGKSTMIIPILKITEKVASITMEPQFGTSLISGDTQLCFVDEFTEKHLEPWKAKQLLQGGFNCVAVKNKDPRLTLNQRCQFFFTAQQEPYWGEEDDNVKERLKIFHMSQLPNINYDVTQWLEDHAIECIVWAGIQVKRRLNALPRSELNFHYKDLVLDSSLVKMRELRALVIETDPVEVEDDTIPLFCEESQLSAGDFDNVDGAGGSRDVLNCTQSSLNLTPPPSVRNSDDDWDDLENVGDDILGGGDAGGVGDDGVGDGGVGDGGRDAASVDPVGRGGSHGGVGGGDGGHGGRVGLGAVGARAKSGVSPADGGASKKSGPLSTGGRVGGGVKLVGSDGFRDGDTGGVGDSAGRASGRRRRVGAGVDQVGRGGSHGGVGGGDGGHDGGVGRGRGAATPSSRKRKAGGSRNPFSNLRSGDVISNYDGRYDHNDESDVDENFISISDAEAAFTKESIQMDETYLQVVRRCIMDHMTVPPGAAPTGIHVASFARSRDTKQQQARLRYVRNYHPNASIQEREKLYADMINNQIDCYEEPDIAYDSWSVVTGQCRSIFPIDKLVRRYPSLVKKIKWLRQQMRIRIPTYDGDELVVREVNGVVRKLVDQVCLL